MILALLLALSPIPARNAPVLRVQGISQEQGWKQPPEPIVRLLDAAPTPQYEVTADGRHVLVSTFDAMPGMDELARPWIALAGLRIDPARHAPFDTGGMVSLSVRGIEDNTLRPVVLPAGARIDGMSVAPDGAHAALTLAFESKLELWLLELETLRLRPLAGPLQATLGSAVNWWSGSTSLLVKLVPEDSGEPPQAPAVPSGPSMQESSGRKTALRTYPDLLRDAHDEALLEHYGKCQLAEVALDGRVRRIGKPGLYTEVEPSPDGKWLLATRVVPPYSYVLPLGLFASETELVRADGSSARVIAAQGLADDIPPQGVRKGPREHQWQQSADATLWWLEALDGGDPRTKCDQRDLWRSWSAPFEDEPAERLRMEHRAQGLLWLADPSRVIAREYDRDRRWIRARLLDWTQGSTGSPRVIEDRSQNDRYGDPGALVLRSDARGSRLVREDGGFAYRRGEGASPEGARAFLDRVRLDSEERTRLWQCDKGWYEQIVSILPLHNGAGAPQLVTLRESTLSVPNYQLRDLEQGRTHALSDFPDPAPELRGVTKELITYKRADGVELSGTLYLPADRKPGERLPLFVWAYPLEYNDAATAGQVSGSPHRFVRVRGASHLFLVTQGYAVLDNATMPIVGDPETMNDTFLEQIVASSQAAIDALAARGVADQTRVGVGGHSYGAFMTANLLAHCDLFRAGIARSGAYNRTLTPFGFQSERRTIWEAPQSYLKLSPFLAADKINEPLLLIHGEQDDNMGTFPIQSERLYQALQGNGGKARLVLLPHEAHGYRSREAVLHTLAEMIEWLDKHVKPAKGG
jgi:dipeptidyl aminopeptidase/acylaminoacyl peptidase